MFCWFFRLMISGAADADNRLSRLTRWHVRRCAACRKFRGVCLLLDDGLRSHPGASSTSAARLSERVAASVGALQQREVHTRVRLRPLLAAACVTLLLLAGAFTALRRHGGQGVKPERAKPVSGLIALVTEDLPFGWSQMIEVPLTGELRNLTDDTESAVRFLVACVPVAPAGPGVEMNR